MIIVPPRPEIHAWNGFRYAGDVLHDAAIILLLCHCFQKSVAGLSARAQWMYLILYVSRYLDILQEQSAYLVVHKLAFSGSTLVVLLCFHFFRETYDRDADTCPGWALALMALLALTLLACPWLGEGTLEILWTWSQLLEGFVMVPQYVCSYRNAKRGRVDSRGVSAWICLMGAYRLFYLLHWLYMRSWSSVYWDPTTWLSGILNVCLFADYVLCLLAGVSCLRRITLSFDDGLRQVGDELRDRLGGCLLSCEKMP